MKLLAFAEQREGKFKKTAYEVTQAARRLADTLGAELVTIVVGHNAGDQASSLGGYGATRVILVEDPRLQLYSTGAYAKAVAEIAKREGAGILLFAASQLGKDLAPRVAAKLEAGTASDCIALKVENGEIIATRPVYAGKASIDVKVVSPTKIFTLRPNVFTASPANGSPVTVERVPVTLDDGDFAAKVTSVKVAEGRPDVTEAAIIVSGGRGFKGPRRCTRRRRRGLACCRRRGMASPRRAGRTNRQDRVADSLHCLRDLGRCPAPCGNVFF
jgi:electron transfer flavoprotein alpha subunit